MTSRLVHLTIPGPAGALEAVLQEDRATEHAYAAVVCHPHPLHGGTLHNKVVHRVAATLHAMGAAVLRFNFRGVGGSEGVHDYGAGELEDARAAWSFMRARWPRAHGWLSGFSFGSWIAARLAAEESDVERLLLVAPPVRTSSFDVMRRAAVPKLVVQGTADSVCPLEMLHAEFSYWAEPKRLVTVEGATHFFDRKLDRLAAAVRELFGAPEAPPGTP
jgi:alpha/beta superfamily hydrolase